MKKLLLLLLCFSYIQACTTKTVLIYGGKTGWIGQKLVALLKAQGHTPVCAMSRIENRHEIELEIQRIKPDFIINAAGITGRPNIDWCEDHKQDTLRANVIGALNLADVAYMHNIHMTNVSTGCIYEYDASHPMNMGKGFTELDEPNFKGSFYSRTKIMQEKLILNYPNVLHLRVKMPVSTELDKGFVGKIIKYKKLINIPNSLAVLDDLLPVLIDMMFKHHTGNFNFVNPGAMSHNEVLELYKKYIDPTFTYENFSVEEQNRILKAGRSNAELCVDKLLQLYPHIPHIKDSLPKLFQIMAAKK